MKKCLFLVCLASAMTMFPSCAKKAPQTAAQTAGAVSNSRQDPKTTYIGLSDAELYEKATHGGIGNCRIDIAHSCPKCACGAYVKISTATWPGKGWPLNPQSRDSTGCVSTDCWPGYSPEMCTSNHTKNAIAQIRDALRHPLDLCGLSGPKRAITPEMVLDQSQSCPCLQPNKSR